MVSEEESIPSETSLSLYGRSALFRQFNDTDFYVEDLGQENLYHKILMKLFPDIKFENVFALGGKPNLLARAEEQKDEMRKSVYIVDKDFDDLLGLVKKIENVFYLERFCIENYFLEEAALVEFVIAERPKEIKRAHIAKKFLFEKEIKLAVQSLTRLFSIFYVVQKHSLRDYIKNTGHSPKFFCKGKNKAVDLKLVDDYANQVALLIKKLNIGIKLSDEIAACAHYFDEDYATAKNISGEYILFILLNVVCCQFELDSADSLDSFRYKLAQQCKFDSLAGLKKRIERHLKPR